MNIDRRKLALEYLDAVSFQDGALAEAVNFIGAHYLHGFDVAAALG